jgi:hypothetical protein
MENKKAERFRRVAALRVQRVLDSLDNLAKCSSRNNYEYSQEEVSKMLNALKAKLRSVEQRFDVNRPASKKERFSF